MDEDRKAELTRRAKTALRDSIASEMQSTIDVMDKAEQHFVDMIIIEATNRINVRIIQ